MAQIAIYPGTFDPITNGHIDIILRAAKLFSEVVVAVAYNQAKHPYLPFETRLDLVQKTVGEYAGVRVVGFDNLLVQFAQEQNAQVILRGLRAVSDFEYEFQLAGMNRQLASHIETLFLSPAQDHMYTSSTLIREIASLGGDISAYVPPLVAQALKR